MKFGIKRLFFLWCVLLLSYFILNSFFSFSLSLNYILFSFFCGYLFFLLSIFLFLFVNSFIDSKKITKIKLPSLSYFFSFVIGIIFFFLVLNSSLYVNAIIGNDLFLSLDVEEDFFSLKNGESFVIDSSYSVLTNPFCYANCKIEVKDLYSGERLFSKEDNLMFPKKNKEKFNISIIEETYGQKIFRVEFSCVTHKSFLCHVKKNDEKFISKAVILEHSLNEEQNRLFIDLNISLYELNEKHIHFIQILDYFKNFTNESLSLNFSSYFQNISHLQERVLKENLTYENSLFLKQNFSGLENSLNGKYREFDKIDLEISNLNYSIYESVLEYNSLLDNLSYINLQLKNISSLGVDISSLNDLDSLIEECNSSVSKFFEYGDLFYKKNLVLDLISSFENRSLVFNENFSYFPSFSLYNFSFEKINFSFVSYNVSFNLGVPPQLCCSFEICNPCSSSNSSSDYPIVFVHGHGFNKEVSVYSSLASMGQFQRELEKEGYFNAGNFISKNYNSSGILEKMNFPTSFSISYYISLQNGKGSDLVPQLSNIEDYSYRLNDYVEGIKNLTGKDKVILVSYSMGGLVSRRYLQIFGEDSVDKLILLSVPNFGVEGIVDRSCSIFGALEECNDLSVGSNFLNKLNSGKIPDITVYNILGEGCYFGGSYGDGIVDTKNAYLPFATNRYFFGSCEGVDFLHEKVLDPSIVPEAFDLIKKFIK